jgi:hypothetical protein
MEERQWMTFSLQESQHTPASFCAIMKPPMPYGGDTASEAFLHRIMINRSADEASALFFSPQFMLIQAFFI